MNEIKLNVSVKFKGADINEEEFRKYVMNAITLHSRMLKSDPMKDAHEVHCSLTEGFETNPMLNNCFAVFTRFPDDSIEGVIVSGDVEAEQVINQSNCYPTIAEGFMEEYVEDHERKIEVKSIRI